MNEGEEQTEERMENLEMGGVHFPVVGVTGVELTAD